MQILFSRPPIVYTFTNRAHRSAVNPFLSFHAGTDRSSTATGRERNPMEKTRTSGGKPHFKLGEMLVKYRIITEPQLKEALKIQKERGGRLGKNLIELGFITEDIFLKFLSSQLVIDSVNLNRTEIQPEVQRMVSLDVMEKFGVLPVKKADNALYLGMTDPTDLNALRELEFRLGLKITPVVLAESQWEFAMQFFRERGLGEQVLSKKVRFQKQVSTQYDVPLLLRELLARRGSDLHLNIGVPPTFRINDQLVRLSTVAVTAEKMDELLDGILSPENRDALKTKNELDFAVSVPDIGRFRVNVYRQKGNLTAALRHIIERVPTMDELGLPHWIANYAQKKQGLILITGPSGHGKSTTMACLIDLINGSRKANIVTVEDPIEFIHHHKASNVSQREIGSDTASFQDGIKYIFRQDPDVICIGEMRDLESISTALTAAETGHLVLATLHTQSAIGTIDRIIDVFPGPQQNQVRSMLAASLQLVFSQRLVPRADGTGRVLAYEKLAASYRMQNAIREARTHVIKTQAAISTEDYMSMEYSLSELVRKGTVRYEEALRYAEDPKLFETLHRQKEGSASS
jgi:twitching motility protein PilT